MDRQIDRIMDRQTRMMGGQTNKWMDMQHTCLDMQKNDDFPIDFAIFTKALWTDGPMDQPTDGPTDGPTDKHTLL